MLKNFIERPVLSTVISIIIVVLGIIGIFLLPIEQYPDIAPPTVQVTAMYSGANANVVMNSVVVPLEQQINGVEGMTYMTSNATNMGTATITVYFRRGINPDIAAVNVQNLVSRATPLLPTEVTQTGVIVRKRQSSTIMMVSLTSTNKDYDTKFIQNYANINIIPQIQRVYGVGDATIFGAKDYSMRVWFNPEVMASYKLSPQEVIAALSDQNIEAAPGNLGENSNQKFQYTLVYTGRYKTPQEFGNIVIRSTDGQILRVKDVAKVELGALNYSVITETDGRGSVAIAISQTAGSNATQVIADVKKTLQAASKTFPPGLRYINLMDATEFLNASIDKVLHTFVEAFILVFIVVFVFLQNFRATLIPAISIPVAIIGTFFFLNLFGFSINLLTLFALVLAIGIVVDDAIVVTEAVHAKLDQGITDPKEAAIEAMKEIAPAIVSITLVMASVFVPVSFIGGTSGVFYKQFGLTLAIAIVLSAINALTLCPALCALFLKPHNEEAIARSKGFMSRFFFAFNILFEKVTNKYKTSLHFLGKRGHRWITLALIVTFTFILFGLMKIIPTGFVPQEDSGTIMGFASLTPGASLDRSEQVVKEVNRILKEKVPNVAHAMNITGVNFMGGNIGSSYASFVIKMDPWDKRKVSINEVTSILTKETSKIKDATFMFFGTPTLQGFGLSTGVEMQLQDKTGGDINKFYNITTNFINTMKKRPEVMMAMTTFNPNFPEKLIEANVAKISEAGMTLSSVMTTLQAYIGSMYVSNFNIYGKQFRVMVQASPEYRKNLNDLDKIYVQTGTGDMAPITEFLTIKDITASQTLSRFNMYASMDATIIPNFFKGYSTGDALKVSQEVAQKVLPNGYSYEYSGMTREEAQQGSQTLLIFGLCLIFVYLLLCALYESYILPLAVIISLPIGLAGVFIFLAIFGLSHGIVNNIYVQISLIMLIGLLAKNAILIVEYAIQRRQMGMSIIEAAVNGAVARLRPILMTSFAFIFGLLPLAMAKGAGAVGNQSIGISAVGGMLFGTLIGVLVVPSLYIIFQTMQDRFSKSGLINSNDEIITKSEKK